MDMAEPTIYKRLFFICMHPDTLIDPNKYGYTAYLQIWTQLRRDLFCDGYIIIQ